ncbi:hypothetical protein LOZ66_001249 [Ophidiomyces ophidiicola]|nr:hypothetical protein LOZ66_001249 [Ophidiomyces ophidiicola]
MARPTPNFNSIIHSPPFTFLVGPAHTKLTIQSGLARHVSRPLDELMNNGHTRESRHHIAVLEEEDVETFVGFCEFAYTGDYSVPTRRLDSNTTAPLGVAFTDSPMGMGIPPPAPSPPRSPGLGDVPDEYGTEIGNNTGIQDDDPEVALDSEKKAKQSKNKKKQKAGKPFEDGGALTPPSTPPPSMGDDQAGQGNETKATPEGNEGEAQASGGWDEQDPTSKECKKASQPKAFHPVPQNPFFLSRRSSVNLWDEFTSLQYTHQPQSTAMGLPSPILRSVSTYAGESSSLDPYVLFHAKLYVFASRYLIPTLAQLCLIKLHRDLVHYPLTTAALDSCRPTNIPMILELLHFSYINTKRDDPVLPTPSALSSSENQLRKLVTHFAACKVRELAGYQSSISSPKSYGDTGKDGGFSGLTIPPDLGFRDLLDGISELASDLVYRMM